MKHLFWPSLHPSPSDEDVPHGTALAVVGRADVGQKHVLQKVVEDFTQGRIQPGPIDHGVVFKGHLSFNIFQSSRPSETTDMGVPQSGVFIGTKAT